MWETMERMEPKTGNARGQGETQVSRQERLIILSPCRKLPG
jgi:hypothetical protein